MSKAGIVAGSLVDVAPPPRPEKKDCRQAAAEALADDVVAWLEETDGKQNRDNVVRDLLAVSAYDWCDGFQFASELQRQGWSPDAQLVEILASAASLLWHAHDRATEAWVKEHQVRLNLEKDTMDEAEVGDERKLGRIIDLEAKRGCYIVNVPGDMPENGGYVVAGEKVWPLDSVASAA